MTRSASEQPASTRPASYRRDIQYLRALAVGLVVLYHFWPNRLGGGFVGVDVFFVISGYLITSHLLSSAESAGRIDVLGFWARRIRRLLPASLAVLAVSTAAVMLWIPLPQRLQALHEVIASAAYVVNWALAANSVDYLASANDPSLVQHFWSLAVEEQFYLLWPLLIAVALWIAAAVRSRGGALDPRRARFSVLVVLTIVAVSSFTASVVLTVAQPSVAYFATTTRAWEFAAGGLLSLVPVAATPGRRTAILVRVIGVATVVGAALLIDGSLPFPGTLAAIPVAGTAAIIWAGMGRPSADRISRDEIEKIGDRSYSIYLWHWPVLIVAPYALGHALGTLDKVLLIAAVLVLASLSKSWIEDPARQSRWLARRWRTFLAAALATLLVIGGAAVGASSITATATATALYTQQQLADGVQCVGAAALLPDSGCADPFSAAKVDTVFDTLNGLAECITVPLPTAQGCGEGNAEGYTHTLALVGDSHGAAVQELVRNSLPAGWGMVSYFATGCPGITTEPIGAPRHTEETRGKCAAWSTAVLEDIESRDDIDAVLFTNFSSRYSDPTLAPGIRLTPSMITETWKELQSSGKQVLALRDVPSTGDRNIPTCVEQFRAEYDPCTRPQDLAVPSDDVLALSTAQAGVPLIDLTDGYCTDGVCHAVVGGLVVYADDSHIARSYALTLRGLLAPRLAAALGTS